MFWKLLRAALRPYPRLLVGVIVFQLAQSAATLVLPALNARIIDDGVVKGEIGTITSLGVIMLGLTLVQVAFALLAVYFAARLAMSVGRDLRSGVFDRVGTFSEREMTTFGTATLITRSTNDVQQVQTFVLTGCTMLVTAPILSVGGIVLALQQDVPLSTILVVAVPVLLVAVTLVIVRMLPLFQKMQARIDAMNGVIREQLTGIRTVRAFVREPFEQARFERANGDVFEASLQSGRLFALVFPIVQLVLNVSSVAVVWFGAMRIDTGEMQVGELTAFLTYLAQILMAVTMATFVVVLLPRASVSGERIAEVLDTESSVVPPSDPITEFPSPGEVRLVDVSFAYPGAEAPVLRNISFTASPGVTAIIGSTGAGKSTLLNLIPRLFDADTGSVLVEGVDVRRAGPQQLWSRIGLVPQSSYLFSGTVASNLRLGRPDATEEELWAALTTAQADDFVAEMTEGLYAPISQGGGTVSGGQRQRLAIARALVARPRIFLFDDSFSALDTTTDRSLREALTRDVPDATLIVVAQRVSTVESADQILVLEAGEIVAVGTHDELLETSDTYAEIVQSQAAVETGA